MASKPGTNQLTHIWGDFASQTKVAQRRHAIREHGGMTHGEVDGKGHDPSAGEEEAQGK